jgi:hypothetical protein
MKSIIRFVGNGINIKDSEVRKSVKIIDFSIPNLLSALPKNKLIPVDVKFLVLIKLPVIAAPLIRFEVMYKGKNELPITIIVTA